MLDPRVKREDDTKGEREDDTAGEHGYNTALGLNTSLNVTV
ncbi:MAG TPA: hypothetical protein VJ202_05460 [Thermodesulfobacteriota bacterium]|nr:hypothetical protein [Thermodesulfobacteriota bacterium]